ncbi:hypothetical protein CSA17_03815 [bacterium DOLJORAL78_65_58]|nr:MAG: hypothetical protein CSB20_06535 [bacterium DOLZORAL124_64_63]PIE76138.1 MAG: hypothetical protein CSA17_03815 [bacterium DOLJORAL78_65_58]
MPAIKMALVILAVAGLPPVLSAQSWESDAYDYNRAHRERRQERSDTVADGPEIKEPLFAMVLSLAEDDSLGRWTGQDFRDFAVATGRQTNLPLDALVSLERRRPRPTERKAWPGMKMDAVWEIILTQDMEPSMPYSILGYHPGTMRVTGHLRLAEANLGRVSFEVDEERHEVRDIRVFRVEEGNVALDVDGWLDALLGKKLDDAAVLAFVAGRGPRERVALAISVGRKGRPIYGEFNLREDKVQPHGRPVARGLSRSCRGLLLPGLEDATSHAWGKWMH